MSYFLTLVSSDKPLNQSLIGNAYDFLKNQGVSYEEEWYVLAPDLAVDIAIAAELSKEQIDVLRDELVGCDVLLSHANTRKKKAFLADMDSTIVASETLDELAGFAGVGEQVSAITNKSMRGEINFEESLTQRVALLEGMDAKHMQTILDQTKFNPGVEETLVRLRREKLHCVLISGGFTFYTSQIAKRAGFHEHHGNVLDIQNDILTGKLAAPILGPDAKLNIMREVMAQKNLEADQILAVGDGANDRFMLGAAGLGGVGYYPKPLLQETLVNQIRFTDLTSLLYMQGLKADGLSHDLDRVIA